VNPVYASVIGLCLGAFKSLGWDIRVTGAEHVPAQGPGVVATNHVGYLDFIFAGYGVREQGRRRLRFVAKREIFDNRYAGPLMRAMRHIPVDRGGDTGRAMAEVERALAEGHLVGMFPEGTISRSFVPLRGRPGAARMAVEAGAPLIPGAVWGTQRIYTKGGSFRATRGNVITVSFGPPVAYEPGEDPTAVTGRLMESIGTLVDRAQRDYPQAPAGADDAWWLPAHLGGSAPTPEEAQRMAREEAEARRKRHEQRARDKGADSSGTSGST
jgi:1-acyl-sn-glycerol-3-phosphate acyltransferase